MCVAHPGLTWRREDGYPVRARSDDWHEAQCSFARRLHGEPRVDLMHGLYGSTSLAACQGVSCRKQAGSVPLQVSELRKLVAKQLQLPADRLRLVHSGATLWDGRDAPTLTDGGAERHADETARSFNGPGDVTTNCCIAHPVPNPNYSASPCSADSVLAFVSPNIQTAKPSGRQGAAETAEDDEERFR